MKRVVYSPKINAWVKADSGVYDLSPYITDCQVNRKVNQVSSATITFRNPNKKFTNGKDGAIFHPMDPIVIFLTRLEGHPVQVFTGYCDTTPYLQLKPGLARISASCTLKRLLYTYWDPGLPFVEKVLQQRGWNLYPDGSGGVGLQNPQAATDDRPGTQGAGQQGNNLETVTDGSIGALLFDVLQYIGNWHPDTIYIENIPPDVFKRAEGLLGDINKTNEWAKKEFQQLMKQIIGESSLGGGDVNASAGGTSNYTGDINHKFPAVSIGSGWEDAVKLPETVIAAAAEEAGKYMGYRVPGMTLMWIICPGESDGRPGTTDSAGGYGLWAHTRDYFDEWADLVGGYESFLNPVLSSLMAVVSWWMVQEGQNSLGGMWHGAYKNSRIRNGELNVHYTGPYDISKSLGGKTFTEAANASGGMAIKRKFRGMM